MFFVVPYSIFWKLKTGQSATDLVDVVEALRGDCLTDPQTDCTLAYHRVTSRKWPPPEYKKAALEIVAAYEHFYGRLYNLLQNEMKKLIHS